MCRGSEIPADSGPGAGEPAHGDGDPQQKQDPGGFLEMWPGQGRWQGTVPSWGLWQQSAAALLNQPLPEGLINHLEVLFTKCPSTFTKSPRIFTNSPRTVRKQQPPGV